MNKLPATIQKITRADSILLVDLEVQGQAMSALLTESPYASGWIKEGCEVSIVFKETEVSLMKNFSGIVSLRNQLACRVTGIEKGAILGCVHLFFGQFNLTSAITSRSIEAMDIKVGDEITALIKANELSILKN
jgi:molybdate transport system regulatory protein